MELKRKKSCCIKRFCPIINQSLVSGAQTMVERIELSDDILFHLFESQTGTNGCPKETQNDQLNYKMTYINVRKLFFDTLL